MGQFFGQQGGMRGVHILLIVLIALHPLLATGDDPILYLHGLCHDDSQDLSPLSMSLQGLSEAFRVLQHGRGREGEIVGEMILCMKRVCSPLESSTFSIDDCNSLATFMTKDIEEPPTAGAGEVGPSGGCKYVQRSRHGGP